VTELAHLPKSLMEKPVATRLEGIPDRDVRAGDLWLLSWNGDYQGLAFIAAAKSGYVLAWPVTPAGDLAFSPGLMLSRSPLDLAVTLWPTRETGIGWHLLDRSLGRLLDPSRIQPIAWAVDDGGNPGLPVASGSALDPSNKRADEAMIEHWTYLCFHTWPPAGRQYLDQQKVLAAGGSSRLAASVLGLEPQILKGVWTGVEPVTDEQLRSLIAALKVESDDLLGPDPLQEVVDRLEDPLFKHPIMSAARKSGLTEGRTRDAARSEYALAARDDSSIVLDSRLLDAIKRVAARRVTP
jgi:hypothetical protein